MVPKILMQAEIQINSLKPVNHCKQHQEMIRKIGLAITVFKYWIFNYLIIYLLSHECNEINKLQCTNAKKNSTKLIGKIGSENIGLILKSGLLIQIYSHMRSLLNI